MKLMRRHDREVTDFDEIADILRRCDTIRLALHAQPYPYVVPLSFGMELNGGRVTLYFHGATEGLKHDLIRADNRICVEADIFHRYAESTGGLTTVYESVIGFGAAALVIGAEAVRGADLICEHCGYPGYDYDRAMLEQLTAVYKIELEAITGKRRSV